MATITPFPVVRHLRATPTTHVIHLAGGKPRHRGVGAAFWFRPLTAVISEVPVDDRERAVLVTHRTADLQQLAVPGVVSYRVADPELAATRVDFSIDLQRGRWTQTPLESIGAAVHGATAEAVASALAGHDLRAALALDLAALGADVHARLAADPGLASLGLAVVGVRFGVLRPEPDVERAIQTPAREALQQAADMATFARRAKAVEREAAIGENELANKIELARRREQLVAQDGANARREAQERAAADAIAVDADASRQRTLAAARADAERITGQASADSERARLAAYAEVPRELLLALALREAAAQLPGIDHLVVTPDLVQGLLARLGAGASQPS